MPTVALSAPEEEPERRPALRLESVRVHDDQVVGKLRNNRDVTLTADPELQNAAAKLLAAAHPLGGAAILVDVRHGKVLAMDQYTRPGLKHRQVLSTPAPSASVFKIVTTTALLEKTSILPKSRVCIYGGERGIERQHLDPPPPEHARCGLFQAALGFSRNAVFAQLATHHLMRDDLLATAEQLGFNQNFAFDAPVQVGTIDLPYNDLEFARAAAGFQDSQLTPLGAAYLTNAIALGGMAGRMRVVAEDGDWTAPDERELLHRIMQANTAWRLTRMMEVTVHSGTSLEAFTMPTGQSYLGAIRVAGKTGTLDRPNHKSTVSWFTGFAPSRDPRVVVTVFLENSTVWRRKANEVARDLLRVYFTGHRGVTDPFED